MAPPHASEVELAPEGLPGATRMDPGEVERRSGDYPLALLGAPAVGPVAGGMAAMARADLLEDAP